MKKICSIMLAAILSAASPALVFSGTPDKILHKQCIYPTVLVCDIYGGHGTGVTVSSRKISPDRYLNIVLTCEHVIAAGGTFNIFTVDYRNWSEVISHETATAYIYASHPEHDMALLFFISDKPRPVAKLGFSKKLFLGNEVFGLGCSQRTFPRLDFGRVTDISPRFSVRTSVTTVPGDSGGPVYHEYEVIGLKKAIAVLPYGNIDHPIFNISWVTPITRLLDWNNAENETFSFILTKTAPQPKLPVLMLNATRFKLDAPIAPPVPDMPVRHF